MGTTITRKWNSVLIPTKNLTLSTGILDLTILIPTVFTSPRPLLFSLLIYHAKRSQDDLASTRRQDSLLAFICVTRPQWVKVYWWPDHIICCTRMTENYCDMSVGQLLINNPRFVCGIASTWMQNKISREYFYISTDGRDVHLHSFLRSSK